MLLYYRYYLCHRWEYHHHCHFWNSWEQSVTCVTWYSRKLGGRRKAADTVVKCIVLSLFRNTVVPSRRSQRTERCQRGSELLSQAALDHSTCWPIQAQCWASRYLSSLELISAPKETSNRTVPTCPSLLQNEVLWGVLMLLSHLVCAKFRAPEPDGFVLPSDGSPVCSLGPRQPLRKCNL